MILFLIVFFLHVSEINVVGLIFSRRSYTGAVGSAYWMAPECLHGKEYCENVSV